MHLWARSRVEEVCVQKETRALGTVRAGPGRATAEDNEEGLCGGGARSPRATVSCGRYHCPRTPRALGSLTASAFNPLRLAEVSERHFPLENIPIFTA